MSHHTERTSGAAPELRMLWYPCLRGTTLTQDVIDAAMHRGRQERAEILARIAAWMGRTLRRGGSTLLAGVSTMQARRAGAALARHRLEPAVNAPLSTARGETPGSVCRILSHAEAGNDAAPTLKLDTPRLAA